MNLKEKARLIARRTKPKFIEIPYETNTKRIKRKHYEMQYRPGRRCLLREQQRLWDLWHKPKGDL
jgi:hypothetical protein